MWSGHTLEGFVCLFVCLCCLASQPPREAEVPNAHWPGHPCVSPWAAQSLCAGSLLDLSGMPLLDNRSARAQLPPGSP